MHDRNFIPSIIQVPVRLQGGVTRNFAGFRLNPSFATDAEHLYACVLRDGLWLIVWRDEPVGMAGAEASGKWVESSFLERQPVCCLEHGGNLLLKSYIQNRLKTIAKPTDWQTEEACDGRR